MGEGSVNRAELLYEPDTKIVLGPKSANILGLPDQNVRLGDALDQVRGQIPTIGFDLESHAASVLSDVNEAIQRAIQTRGARRFHVARSVAEPTLIPSPPPRHLQAGVYVEVGENWLVQMKEPFAAGWRHIAEIHIGPPKRGRVIAPEEFPQMDLLPTQSGVYFLTVVFMEPDSMQQPLLKTIILPPDGPSSACSFHFTPKESATSVEARVTVLHENRVLQSAVLRGSVARFSREELEELGYRRDDSTYSSEQSVEKPDEDSKIRFVISGAVQQAIRQFNERPRFDAALILNDMGGVSGATLVRGNRPAYLRVGASAVERIKEDLEKILEVDWDMEEYRGLYSEGTTELLRTLAIFGKQLYKIIVVGFKLKKLKLDNAPKIQVIIANKDSRIPLEFIYDYPAPRLEGPPAPVCPHAEEALETGVGLSERELALPNCGH